MAKPRQEADEDKAIALDNTVSSPFPSIGVMAILKCGLQQYSPCISQEVVSANG